MLVLSRRLNEQIIISDDITITVVSIHNGAVQLGIEAPKDVNIRREEITGEDQKDRNE